MEVRKRIFDQISTRITLPTLPHILLKLFEACSQDSVNLDEIAAIVSKDPALSVNLLKLVNSKFSGLPLKIHEIDRAVDLIGASGIRKLTNRACAYEAFPKSDNNGSFNLKGFWWHSLRCAFFAKNMAENLKLGQPDEAYVSGLLHDIGKVVLRTNFNAADEDIIKDCQNNQARQIEEAHYGATHCEVATWFLDSWDIKTVISDPVRYHHESPIRIAQALPNTQIVYIANFLCQDAESKISEGIVLAQKILGIGPSQCNELIKKSNVETKDVADAFGVIINADESALKTIEEEDQKIQDALVREVRNVSMLAATLESLLTSSNQSEILSNISDGLKILLDINRFGYFLLDEKKGVLFGYTEDLEGRYLKNNSLAVSMSQIQSLLVKTMLNTRPLASFDEEAQPLTILDEQIIGLFGGQGIYCLPITARGESIGVIVLSIQRSDLLYISQNEKLLKILIHKGALALQLNHLKQNQLHQFQTEHLDASSDLTRRVVHEVNNPLSIIKNYLKILEVKLAGEKIASDEIKIVNEEISRVAIVLKKLTDFSKEKPATQEMTDVNALLMDIVKLTQNSLPENSGIKLRTNFENDLPKVNAGNADLKQVFINLIKNACEAMPSGGNLYIQTRYVSIPTSGWSIFDKKDAAGCIEIQFRDDGPGVPDAIKENLFNPYVTTKKEGHFGLGLSIAHNIVKSFQGQMTCESILDKGSVFKIELPVKGGS